MKIADWCSFDVSALPDDVLKDIYRRVHTEVSMRRNKEKLSLRAFSIDVSKKHLKTGHLWHKNGRLNGLSDLLADDWSGIYPDAGGDENFYVYAHINPTKKKLKYPAPDQLNISGLPFYIGKGCGGRAWDLNRNEGHGKIGRAHV